MYVLPPLAHSPFPCRPFNTICSSYLQISVLQQPSTKITISWKRPLLFFSFFVRSIAKKKKKEERMNRGLQIDGIYHLLSVLPLDFNTICSKAFGSGFTAAQFFRQPSESAGFPASVEAISRPITHKKYCSSSPPDNLVLPEWKKLRSKDIGLKTSMITKPTRIVLDLLQKKGYEVYLVGGCVRDLILKRIPKDFDVITSADLREVMRTFSRCEIVGRRFPICHVHINDTIVEVSSFSTPQNKSCRDMDYFLRKPPGCSKHDYARWKNCLGRDFTINGLMFDPYAKLVYDYMGGLEDIKKANVRTIIPAHTSFGEDCARVLRGVRIAARLGFRLTRETAHSVKDFSCSVLNIDKSRLLMEMNYMLAFGSAEASLRLLWKYGLLEILLPIQAAYLVSQGFRRRDKRSNMLLTLFSNLDKLLAPDRPCHNSLWVGILAFHLALADEPRDPLVVAIFCLAIYNGGNVAEAVEVARTITQPHTSFTELLEPQHLDQVESIVDEVFDLASSVKSALSMMTDEFFVSQAMAKYQQAPFSDLVFIPLQLYLKALKIFDCVGNGKKDFISKRGNKINYESLAHGGLEEVRHVFARVVFDTIYPPNQGQISDS